MSRRHTRSAGTWSVGSWLSLLALLALIACGGDDKHATGIDAQVGSSEAGASMMVDAGLSLDAALPTSGDAAAGFFLPSSEQFNGFHKWASMAAEAPPEAPPGPHSLGDMTVYINKKPPTGSTEFPLGTLIVKETNEPDPVDRQVFALAKRGGSYNPTGAVGWEWFEFTNRADGTVFQKWRGLGPPPTTGSDPADNCSGYGGDPTVCNNCHLAAAANDFIWTVGYDLKKF